MNIRKILKEELYKQYNNKINIDYLIKQNLHENINRLILNESQESKSQSKAIKLAMQNGMDREKAEQFVRINLRNDISELRHSDTAKFTLGCARLYFEGQLSNAKTVNMLNQILSLITKKYYDKFDQNLNNLSMNNLSEQFDKELKNIEAKNRNDVNSKEYVNQGYKIVSINSYDEAKQYYQYMYNKSPWCITYKNNMWETYTNNGNNQVYFCLKNGFENIEAPEETGNFKDEYGLSMISVIVDEDGNLKYSTTRWNHANRASGDHDLTAQEISDIVGVNFYNTFKPNKLFKENIQNALRRLKNGENPNNIFNAFKKTKYGFIIIGLNNKYNIINPNNFNLLSEQWFDKIYDSNDNFIIVELNGNYNIISNNGSILSKQWFDKIYDSNGNFKIVELNGKYNIININGKLLNNQWFDRISDFNEGFVRVKLNNKYNFINTKGNFFNKQWFDWASDFNDVFARIKLNDKYNFIDKNGNILSKQWFDYISDFNDGFANVNLNDNIYKIDKSGKLYNN